MDDLSHLQYELACQIRATLADWHQDIDRRTWDEIDTNPIPYRLGRVTVTTLHVAIHESARARLEWRRARLTTAIAIVAALLSLAGMCR